MLKLINLSKTYQPKNEPEVKALDNVSLTLGDTGIVFVLGKSGSGKSTMLNVLGCLDNFDSGDIILNGKSLKSLSQGEFDNYRNTHIGFVFQDNNLLEKISVNNNIGIALDLQGIKDKGALINRALDKVDLKGYSSRYPNQLSGGQKQRVAIARAIVKNPPILLADEPTGNLDSATSKQIFELLKELSKERLVVVVSHDREAAELYGDRVIELVDGRMHIDSLPLETQERTITKTKEDIKKARYPFKKMLAMSLNNMKIKWIRMSVTIILFMFALTMFGIGLSAATLDINVITYNTMNEIDEEILYLAPRILPDSRAQFNGNMTQSQVGIIESNLNKFDFKYIYNGCYVPEIVHTQNRGYYYTDNYLSGFVSFNESDLHKYNMSIVIGRLPINENEVAIPSYIYEAFKKNGYYYFNNDFNDNIIKRINGYDEIIGLELTASKANITPLTIVGIVDTNFNSEQFDYLKIYNSENATQQEYDAYYRLQSALDSYISYSVHACLIVNEKFIEREFLDNQVIYARVERFSYLSIFGYEDVDYITRTGKLSYLEDKDISINGKYNDYSSMHNDEIILSREFLISFLKRKGSEFSSINNFTDEVLKNIINDGYTFKIMLGKNNNERIFTEYNENNLISFNIVGYYSGYAYNDEDGNYQPEFIMNDAYIENFISEEGIYKCIFTNFSNDDTENLELINFSYREDIDNNYSFPIITIIRGDLDSFAWETAAYRAIGLLASIALGIFTILMMLNFIIASINAKNKETGILRALGISSHNVFMIFFIESLIISLIGFSVSIYPLIKICDFINMTANFNIVRLPIFIIDFLKILSMLGISIIIAFAGSFLPIYKLAKKKPVEIFRQ